MKFSQLFLRVLIIELALVLIVLLCLVIRTYQPGGSPAVDALAPIATAVFAFCAGAALRFYLERTLGGRGLLSIGYAIIYGPVRFLRLNNSPCCEDQLPPQSRGSVHPESDAIR